jgi:hypothetical protein
MNTGSQGGVCSSARGGGFEPQRITSRPHGSINQIQVVQVHQAAEGISILPSGPTGREEDERGCRR